MFCPQDLVGVGRGAVEEDVFLNGRRAFPVRLHMIQFTQEGMSKLGQGIRDVARRYGLSIARVKELMANALYSAPPNPSLYFLFHIPELAADVHVEVPKKFWRLTDLAREQEISEQMGRLVCPMSVRVAGHEDVAVVGCKRD
jgi:hypothetical protein